MPKTKIEKDYETQRQQIEDELQYKQNLLNIAMKKKLLDLIPVKLAKFWSYKEGGSDVHASIIKGLIITQKEQ